jgi:hypothetical protein
MKVLLSRVLTCALSLSLMIATFSPVQNASAWGRFDGGHHPAYGGGWAHQPPVVVHRTYVDHRGGGCVGCGIGVAAVAGLIGGAVIGAAIAGSPPPERTMVVEQAPQPVYVQQGMPIGTQVAGLPPGCGSMNVNGQQLYQCGPTWYQPFFGGNGVYYTVVPQP